MPNINKINSASLCIHKNHIFSHPLCKDMHVLQRIAYVVFHALTLGIPLAIYKIRRCHRSKITSAQKNNSLQELGVQTVIKNKDIKPYTSIGQKTIEFAKKKLEENPGIVPHQFTYKHPPKNSEIERLTNYFYDVAWKELEVLLKRHPENPWNNQEVINAADNLMKISYAISNLTLDDLKPFTDELLKDNKRTYAKALTAQDSYQYRTFYFCSQIYHCIRGAYKWEKNLYFEDEEDLYPQSSIPKDYAALFYQKGTIQNSWLQLYNDYCHRVRLYVDERTLKAADPRHCNWTRKDEGVSTFNAVPDTLPT